ncbi:MAG TPA: protein phosphatase 2C domain-containing protein, partial [Actinopolymorphaceae bacterium]|nr:protein phosphatase 2C domain-containing protein [Actinopolymorphaceae bacterium]
MTLALRYAAQTDVGLGPKTWNEDSGYAGPHLLAIADGMGGTVGGDVASAITISTVRALDAPGHPEPLRALGQAAIDANAHIAARIQTEPHLEGMGTTLTAVLFEGQLANVAHIGDSRAYLLRDGRLRMITHDHTFVQSLVDEGRITAEEAEHHPHRSLILRALEGRQDARPDLFAIDVKPGDRLLVCSDGLDNASVKDDAIAEVLIRSASPDAAADALVSLALDRGSPDNVTCVVAFVVDTDKADGSGGTAPMLVGAAAGGGARSSDDSATTEHRVVSSPLARSARHTAPDKVLGDEHHDDADLEEQLRYAPRPPRRFGWLTRLIGVAVILGLLGVGGRYAYDWTQDQYYVGAYPPGPPEKVSGSKVAIFRGISQQIPGVRLSSLYELNSLRLGKLPAYHRERVSDTIPVDNLG